MKVATLTQTVVVEDAAKSADVLRTLCAHVLALARLKPWQDVVKEKCSKAPRVGRKEPQRASACTMLVESDIRGDIHGIMP